MKKFGVLLQTPDGAKYAVEDWAFSVIPNVGIQWSATAAGLLPIDTYHDDSIYQLSWYIDNGSVTPPTTTSTQSCRLIAMQRWQEWGIGTGYLTRFTGVDETSWQIAADGNKFGTFKNLYSDAILTDIANYCAINGSTGNRYYTSHPAPVLSGVGGYPLPQYLIPEYDASHGKPVEHFNRILHDAAYNWYIDPLSGRFSCASVLLPLPGQILSSSIPTTQGQVDAAAVHGNIIHHVSRYGYDQSRWVDGIKIVKNAKMASRVEFAFTDPGFKTVSWTAPLDAVQVRDLSTSGSIVNVSLFDGPVPSKSNLISTISLQPGLIVPAGTSTAPALSATLVVLPGSQQSPVVNARIRIDGVPHGTAAYDTKFWVDVRDGIIYATDLTVPPPTVVTTQNGATISTTPWYPRETVEAILIPTRNSITAVDGTGTTLARRIWYNRIRGYHHLTAVSQRFEPGWLAPWQALNLKNYPKARTEAVHARGNRQGLSTTFECWAYPWT